MSERSQDIGEKTVGEIANCGLSAAEWAMLQYGDVDLGDKRLNRRAVQMAESMAEHPEESIPKQMKSWKATSPAYRLINTQSIAMEMLLRPHIQQTITMSGHVPIVLMIEDTSELDFTSHHQMTGLGPVGDGRGRGLLLHDTLAIDPRSRSLIGLAFLQVVVRVPTPTPRPRYADSPESRLWTASANAVGRAPDGASWVHVSDRGSDTLDYMIECLDQGKQFIIRAKHNRNLISHEAETPSDNPSSGNDGDGNEETNHLLDRVRHLAAVPGASRERDIPARDGNPARTAQLSFSWTTLTVRMPVQAPSTVREHEPIDLSVLRVWEENPPSGCKKPLEWVLLTTLPIHSERDAYQIADWYSCRWICEDYHQCLKTGCHIEKARFDSADDTRRLLGFKAPLAVRLLQLRDLSRNAPDLPANNVVDQVMVDVLALKVKSLSRNRILTSQMTIADFWRAVAQLGGHLGRKCDGKPGWRAIWDGWMLLSTLTSGAQIMLAIVDNQRNTPQPRPQQPCSNHCI
jgi:hypothetical protein